MSLFIARFALPRKRLYNNTMPIVFFNVEWMSFNSMLAFLAVLLGYFFLQAKPKALKIFFGLLWLVFLPNTIYLFTDLKHILYQWNQVDMFEKSLILIQYMILEFVGLVTFILAFHPFEKMLEKFAPLKRKRVALLIAFNFLVAFGLVLGRVERINSWEIVTQPMHVLGAAWHILSSLDLVGLTILFGLFCNFVYFLFHESIMEDTKRVVRKLYVMTNNFLD